MELTFLDLVKIMMGAFVGAAAGVFSGNVLYRAFFNWRQKRLLDREIQKMVEDFEKRQEDLHFEVKIED